MDYEVSDHEILNSEVAFDGRVVRVLLEEVRLPDGRTARWETVSHPGAVGMVPLLPDGRVVMVRQYRHAVRGVLLEIPAGKLDRDETPEVCAQRELAEEVGFQAGTLEKLAEFYNSPGYSGEAFHLFLARELRPASGEPEPDEFLEIVELDISRALEMIESRDIQDAKTIIGLALTLLRFPGGMPGGPSSA